MAGRSLFGVSGGEATGRQGRAPASPEPDIRVRWVRGIEGLRSVGPAYDALVDACGEGALFRRRGWVEAMADAWGLGPDRGAGSRALALLWAEREGRAIGVAPLQIERKGWARLGLRRLHFLGAVDGPLADSRADFLIPDPADRRSCLVAFRDFLLAETQVGWDVLELTMMPETSSHLALLDEVWPGDRRAPE